MVNKKIDSFKQINRNKTYIDSNRGGTHDPVTRLDRKTSSKRMKRSSEGTNTHNFKKKEIDDDDNNRL